MTYHLPKKSLIIGIVNPFNQSIERGNPNLSEFLFDEGEWVKELEVKVLIDIVKDNYADYNDLPKLKSSM